MSTPETPDVSQPTFTTPTSSTWGRVKWFNNKAGYGFITVSSGEHEGSDVFVHHSAIQVAQEQYRYLVQGEYVDFKLCPVEEGKDHKWQAGTVKGINNGKLMCETRLETRETRMNHNKDDESSTRRTRQNNRDDSQPHYRVRTRGSGPRDGDEWMLVRRRATRSHTPNSPQASSPQPVLRGRPSKS